jgi:alpha-N-acetylglucosamine transferase
LKPIAEIAVDQNSTADEVIAKTLDVYKRDDGEDLKALTFRLREKHSRSLMKVYRNMSIKRQGIYDGKQLVLENIDPLVQIPQVDVRQYLIVVQILNPETIGFEEVFEFAIEKTDTLASLAQRIHEKCNKIPPDCMAAAKVSTVWGLDNLYGINLPYVNLNDTKQTLTGQPFFIASDGVVLL